MLLLTDANLNGNNGNATQHQGKLITNWIFNKEIKLMHLKVMHQGVTV